MDCQAVEGKLHAYLEDEVPTREDGLIRAHLALCTRCSGHAQAMEAETLAVFPAVPEASAAELEKEILRALPGGPPWRKAALLLTPVVVIAVVLVWVGFGGGGDGSPRGTSRGGGPGKRSASRDGKAGARRFGPGVKGSLPEAGIEIRGAVKDDEGLPIAGAEVVVTLLTGDPAPADWAARTDLQGRFSIHSVDQEILMELRKPGYVPHHVALSEIPSWLAEGRERQVLEVMLTRAGSVTGSVLDEAGLPVSGVRVLFRHEVGRMWRFRRTVPRGEGEVRSETDGSYRLDSVPLGQPIRVLWIHEDYALLWTEPFRVDLSGGMVRKAAVLAPGGGVSGVVVDFREALRAGADVQVQPAGGGAPHPVWDRTGKDGRFRIDYLPLGEWELRVGFGGAILWKGEFKITAEERSPEIRVKIEKEEPVVPAAPLTGVVRGRALPLEGGEGLQGGEVRVRGEGLSRSVQVGGGGSFQVEGSPGTWTVQVSAPGRAIVVWDGVRVTAGSDTDLGDVFLAQEAAIEGRAVDGVGQGVSGAEVRVLDLMGQPVPCKAGGSWQDSPRLRTDGEGRFTAGGLVAGEYWVVVSHPEMAPLARTVQVAPGGEVTEWTLDDITSRTMEFHGPDDAEAVPTLVQIFAPGGPLLLELRPDQASLSVRLAPGSYEAVVVAGENELRHPFTVTAEEEPPPIRLAVP